MREQEAKAMDRELVRETVRVPLRSLVGLTATVEQLTRQVRGLEARLSDAHEAYVKGPPGSSIEQQLHIRRQAQELRLAREWPLS